MTMERWRAALALNTELFQPGVVNTQGDYGEVPGQPVGKIYKDREQLHQAKVHKPRIAGISAGPEGAYSIVANGSYGDKDEGDILIYYGTGGTDDLYSGKGAIITSQTFNHRDNNSLLRSSLPPHRPVRVVRGHGLNSPYAPLVGYRYDGLYNVVKAGMEEVAEGFSFCRYELRRCLGQPPLPRRVDCFD
ncbi:hypothetical protein AX16_007413 [Volvariella volvacea WC 439]|nr:hypothetical protein AX16_007413 [Volvariella volvacea WC 439]